MQGKDFTKAGIRSAVRTSRARRTLAERDALTFGFTQQLTALHRLHAPQMIACYLPRPGEPDTLPYIDWAHTLGTTVLLPIAHPDHTLTWAPYAGPHHLNTGAFNILEPSTPQLPNEALSRAQLLVIPASAVDHTGTRLGWGRGYYDRSLTALTPRPPTYAVIHENELFDQVPSEPHDTPIDGAVTPLRLLTFPHTPDTH